MHDQLPPRALPAKRLSRKKCSVKRSVAISIIVFSAIVAVADAIFKGLALNRLPEEGSRLRLPIDFALHKNPGIAFDIPLPLPIVTVLSVIIIGLLVRYAMKSWSNRPDRTMAALMIVLGALGNLGDRVINDFTTDYIILFARSAINLSDVLIFLGTVLLLYYTESKNAVVQKDKK